MWRLVLMFVGVSYGQESDCSEGFRCENQKCIRARDFCNGVDNCGDGSDEIRTDVNLTIGIACRQRFDNRRDSSPKICILPQSQESKSPLLCKIKNDCSTGFLCNNQLCIKASRFCDGGNDCGDGSDDIKTDGYLTNTSDGIACRQHYDRSFDNSRRICILPQNQTSKTKLLCKINRECDEGFLCGNEKCIDPYDFCEGFDHCGDGSDEIPADKNLTNASGIACRHHFDNTLNSKPSVCILPQNQASKSKLFCEISVNCSEGFICRNELCVFPGDVCGEDNYCGYADGWTVELGSRSDRFCSAIYSSWTCVLPKKHICDAISYCEEGIDECLCGNEGSKEFLDNKCFRCLQNHTTVIPLGRLCDGIFDCSDLTDECLCSDEGRPKLCDAVQWEKQSAYPLSIYCTGSEATLGMEQICDDKYDCEDEIDEENCRDSMLKRNPSKIRNETELSTYFCLELGKNVTACDRIPECTEMTYDEECLPCANKPRFCDNFVADIYLGWLYKCESGQPLIGRICDGVSDCQLNTDELDCGRWFYCKNETNDFERITWDKVCDTFEDCSDGSDEGSYQNCSYFTCKDEGNVKYKDNRQVCDGTPDCLEGSDECQEKCIKSVFSDTKSMIKSQGIVGFVWAISVAAVVGNIAVLVHTTHVVFKQRKGHLVDKSAVINKALILNLSVSDLIVGIYTLAIVVQNSKRERYCLVDQDWRSSSTCSAIGSLLVIGSQQSVFTMVIITVFRTLGITYKHKFKPNYRKFGFVIIAAWIASVSLAVIPLMQGLEDYFIDSVWYKGNKLFATIDKTKVKDLTNWLTLMHENISDSEIGSNIGSWATLEMLINEMNPNLTVQRRFGFYSTHAVCLPTFFPNRETDTAWAYSVLIISINFVSFVVVFVGSVIIYRSATAPNMALRKDVLEKRTATLQAKLSRIVITDFCCWIPVCIMGFIQLSGVGIPKDAYIPIALIVIPINSSLNPFLYSNVPDTLWAKLKNFYFRKFGRSNAPGARANRGTLLSSSVVETTL